MIKLLNNYFFGEDEISLSDALWYYGSLGFMVLVLLTVALPVYISM